MTATRATTALLVGVDLGKTGCRAVAAPRLWRQHADDSPAAATVFRHNAGPGAAGLAEPDGVTAAAAAVGAVLDGLLGADRAAGLVVGSAGGEADPRAAHELGARLAERFGCPAAVTTDAITSHAGALSGRPGVVLAAGTGAVAVGVRPDGRVSAVDGWGQWLGDDGSGTWIGRASLQAVLRARDGRGPATALTGAAQQRYGDPARLPYALPLTPGTVRDTAAFVPDVVACAAAGDAVATNVLARAGALLAETTAAAVPLEHRADRVEVAVVGGLADAGEAVLGPWRAGLPVEFATVSAEGTSADGALLLAERTDLPHETHVRRHTPEGTS